MLPIRHLFSFIIACQILLASSNFVHAQANKRTKKVEIPDPEAVLIETKDQVQLRAEWFAGTKGKETVPMIMIHDWDSDRTKLTALARKLQQKEGYAVVVPDLRGHGDSLTVKGMDDELDRKRFKKNEMASFFEDIDACRRFLQEKNDAGELNLDMLAVLACGKMSIHAVNWCVSDWSWEPMNGVKQGQNVKSLFLISPRRRFKSLSMSQSLKTRLFSSKSNALPLMICWGQENEDSDKEGQAIYKSLKKSRKEPEKFSWEKQTLFHVYYGSNMESGELLADHAKDIEMKIVSIIENKVLTYKDELPWQSRKVIKK